MHACSCALLITALALTLLSNLVSALSPGNVLSKRGTSRESSEQQTDSSMVLTVIQPRQHRARTSPPLHHTSSPNITPSESRSAMVPTQCRQCTKTMECENSKTCQQHYPAVIASSLGCRQAWSMRTARLLMRTLGCGYTIRCFPTGTKKISYVHKSGTVIDSSLPETRGPQSIFVSMGKQLCSVQTLVQAGLS